MIDPRQQFEQRAFARPVGPDDSDSFPVTIRVDAGKPLGDLKPIWRFFGADEPNYAYMKHGKKLLAELGELSPKSVYFRTHNLLTSGDGTPALKWGSTGAYSEDAQGRPVVAVVQQLPASERFFAGGDTTVRGFALDQLGITGKTIDETTGLALGGNALVIFNGELRMPVRGGVSVVGFLDAGNVFARATDIDLGALRAAAGFGVRYRSPVGPIRFDLGFKLRREERAGRREGLTAVHISLGQAF